MQNSNIINNYYKYFTPESIGSDADVLNKRRFLLASFALTFLITALSWPLCDFIGYKSGVAVCIFILTYHIFLFAILRQGFSAEWAGNGFVFFTLIAFTWAVVTSGGLTSAMVAWFICIKVSAFWFTNKKTGYLWSAAIFVVMLVLFALQVSGIKFPSEMSATAQMYFSSAMHGLILVYYLVIIATYEHWQTQARIKIEQQRDDLNIRNQEIVAQNKQIQQQSEELQISLIYINEQNTKIEQHKELALRERDAALKAHEQVAQTLFELKATQTQLVAAEKMASLGLLVSNVAHEINTPIGAVKSSGALIADTLESTLADMPKLFALLEPAPRGLFVQLVLGNKVTSQTITVREERLITKQIAAQLEQANVEDTNRKARLLTKLRAYQNPLDYLPLLQHQESDFILGVASNIADVVNSTHNINSAVEKVSRVVYALKALSGDDVLKAPIVAPLQPDMEKALAKYQSQMHSVELVKDFQADMPAIHADHDAMEQLCIHLVMNALQAMNYTGKLSLGLKAENNQAIISVTDTGTGIADDIKDRIFEPFFSTRLSGEGSGMGLAIVKRIVEQHHGTIDVQTEVGTGTTVTVSIPFNA